MLVKHSAFKKKPKKKQKFSTNSIWFIFVYFNLFFPLFYELFFVFIHSIIAFYLTCLFHLKKLSEANQIEMNFPLFTVIKFFLWIRVALWWWKFWEAHGEFSRVGFRFNTLLTNSDFDLFSIWTFNSVFWKMKFIFISILTSLRIDRNFDEKFPNIFRCQNPKILRFEIFERPLTWLLFQGF